MDMRILAGALVLALAAAPVAAEKPKAHFCDTPYEGRVYTIYDCSFYDTPPRDRTEHVPGVPKVAPKPAPSRPRVSAGASSAASPSVSEIWRFNESEVRSLCRRTHSDYSLQAACMRNERRGHSEFLGGYGMPTAVELDTKATCWARHERWSLRAACMRNQSGGYKAMNE